MYYRVPKNESIEEAEAEWKDYMAAEVKMAAVAAVPVTQDSASLAQLTLDAVRGVSMVTDDIRRTASECTTQQGGHETHMEVLDAGLGDDGPSSSDPIGTNVLRAAANAHQCSRTAEHLRQEADRLDSSAFAVVPPAVVHAQMKEYNALR
eukprot:3123196-Prymnesium_polylepis.1